MDAVALSREEARRIAVRAQLLAADRPTGVVSAIRGLSAVQRYPYADIAPSADLVLWSRLGDRYEPDDLQKALEVDRALFEFDGMIRPVDDLPVFRAQMARPAAYAKPREWLEINREFRDDVVRELEDRGPLPSHSIPDTARFPWPSSGWTNDRNVTQMLEVLMMRGVVAISGHENGRRMWDLAERVYPDDHGELPYEEAWRRRLDRRLRALGIARPRLPREREQPREVEPPGIPATVEDTTGVWRVHPDVLPWREAEFEGRTALLSPFDLLVADRERTLDLFGFEYALEMFTPKARRRWGYFPLPVLYGDRLVGKLEATADRPSAALRVAAIHEDEPHTAEMRESINAEVEALANWLGLRVEPVS